VKLVFRLKLWALGPRHVLGVTSGHKTSGRPLTPAPEAPRITGRETLRQKSLEYSMSQELHSAVEQAVSRALRDNLERIQRTSDEIQQSIADVVAACSSSKPTNALPAMLRAQTGAASLAAALDVISRFVAVTLQPAPRSPFETEIARIAGTISAAEAAAGRVPLQAEIPATLTEPPSLESQPEPQHEPPQHETQPHPAPPLADTRMEEVLADSGYLGEFNVSRLPADEQELHRRANRVAKVSMQDIKMLRPEQVRLGRENRDLCIRLRDDIEKAHREYDRRFKPIMDHPVDYFYRWMVEILADGDAHALGEYPYTPVAGPRH
jgi:hypothetical protein